METNTPLVFRLWRYLRDGFHFYLSFPVSIVNFTITAYYLLLENIDFLQALFPSFFLFFGVSLLVALPTSILLGWLHIRKTRAFSTETVLSTLHNPLGVYNSVIFYKSIIDLLRAQNVEPSKELLDFYNFWLKLDKMHNWRPTK